MGNYTIFVGFKNPRKGRQARNLTTHVSKILDVKSSSEQIFSKNCRWVPLTNDVLSATDIRFYSSLGVQNFLYPTQIKLNFSLLLI